MSELTSAAAQAAIGAAIAKASEMGVSVNVAVIDGDCELKAFLRMDHALAGAADVAINKARTSALFDMATEEVGELSGADGPLQGIELADDTLVSFGGGVPIRDALGAVIGAVGVSGGSVDDDVLLAQTGADAALRLVPVQATHIAISRPASRPAAIGRAGARPSSRPRATT